MADSFDNIEPELCPKCGSVWWILDVSQIDLHGHGVRCAKCNHFLKWTGKKNPRTISTKISQQAKYATDELCKFCGLPKHIAKGMGVHFQTDHIIPLEFGGTDSPENFERLCSPCHYLKNALTHRTKAMLRIMPEKK